MARAADAGDRDGALLDAVDAFLEREVRPFARSLDHADTWPAQIVEKMRAMGLFGCIVEERYGGLGLSAGTYARVIERISARLPAGFPAVVADRILAGLQRSARSLDAMPTSPARSLPS